MKEEARRRLLGPQKQLLERAAYTIRDAVDRTIRIHPNVGSRWARWAYRLRIGTVGTLLPWVAIWATLLLTFYDTPTWCLPDPDACDPDTDLSDLYPRVTPRFMPRAWSIGLEFGALAVLLSDYCLQVLAEGRAFIVCHPRRRGFWHQLLLGASFLSLAMTACFPASISSRGGSLLRLLFLVIYSGRLRQEMSLTLRILPQFGKALVLLLAVFLLYAVLGLSLFSPYSDDAADREEANIYFKDFGTAFLSTWELFLYWTFPSIMVLKDPDGGPEDFLNPNWIQCVFAFSFMLLCIYLVLNLGLAIVCDIYSERKGALERQREAGRRRSLERAFALLRTAAAAAEDHDGQLQPPPATISDDDDKKDSGQSSSSNVAVPTYVVQAVLELVGAFASSAPRLTRRGIAAVVEDLDPKRAGVVSQDAFMRLPELLFSPHGRQQHLGEASSPRPASGGGGDAKEADGEEEEEEKVGKEQEQQLQQQGYTQRRPRFVDLWCPRMARSGAFHRFERFVKGPVLEGFIDVVILANVALALAAHGGENKASGSEDQRPGRAFLSQSGFTYVAALIFSCECLSKLLVLGWRRYVASYMNVFDAVLTLLTVLGAIYELGGFRDSAQHHALLVFELLRVLRLFRALLSIPTFRATALTFAKILPSASALLLNLFALTFAFAVVGLEAYGGLINKDPAKPQYNALKGTYYWQDGLYIFNWNDVGGCFIVLVLILIDSSLIQPFCDALGAVNPHRKPFIACFFVLYYVMGQLIVLNVVVAFILEAFMEAQATEASVEQGKGGTGEGSRDDGGDETETDRGTASLPLSGADDGQRPPPQQMKALPVAPDGDAGVV